MLAVLVVLLMKNRTNLQPENGTKPFVCYIPDCEVLYHGETAILTMIRHSILLDDPDYADPLATKADISSTLSNRYVILVADQWESIGNGDAASSSARVALYSFFPNSELLQICGMSVNSSQYRSTLHKQTIDINCCYYGVLSDDEFGVWLQTHHEIFREMKTSSCS